MVVSEAGVSKDAGASESPISKRYKYATVMSLIAGYVMASLTMGLLFTPVISLVNSLDSNTKPAPVVVNLGVVMSAAFIGILLSLTAIVLTAKAFSQDVRRRWFWGILCVLAFIVLSQAGGLMIMAPKLVALYKDLGV